jgi:hypothetical protein
MVPGAKFKADSLEKVEVVQFNLLDFGRVAVAEVAA